MNNKIIVLGAGTAGLIAALCLREKYPYLDITIVKSKEIGIVGVGEGSTEHWDAFMSYVGIDHFELITKTDATVKIGILFKDWLPGKEYVHSVGHYTLSGLNRPEIFNHLFLSNNSRFPLSPEFDHVFSKNNVTITPNLKTSNQYHFDTHKLNDYLIGICTSRSIGIVDGIVNDVEIDSEGFLKNIKLETGEVLDADLFIDCSGLKRVLSSKLENKWVSYSKFLPMNHALAFPTEFDEPDEIEPYTTATALTSGWVWKIPTQSRYGNGYVFCDGYTTPDDALMEVSKHLGKTIEKAARDIKFEAGRIEQFWKNNVVSIGLSSSFAEPLEAQSIGFSILQSMALLDHLDVWYINKNISEKYNRLINDSFDNIVNYLQLHYLGERSDSSFWQERPYSLTSFNSQFLEALRSGCIDPVLFNIGSSYLMFSVPNWYQVLAGLELIDRETILQTLNRNRQSYNNGFAIDAQNRINEVNNSFRVIKHRDYLDLIRHNYNYKIETSV